MTQHLPAVFEACTEFCGPGKRFAEEPAVTDFLMSRDSRSICTGNRSLSLYNSGEFSAAWVVFGQRLLRCANQPDFAISETFEILRQSLEVENEMLASSDVLPEFINDKQDIVLVRGVADDVNDLLHPVIQEINKITGGCGEGSRVLKSVGYIWCARSGIRLSTTSSSFW